MFTQTRTNLKIIGVILFTMTFLVGVFFIKTTNAEAAGTTQSFNVSYSLSPVTSIPNNDGGITTTVFIACVPGSGDIYDINTGKPCISITTNILIGCAVGSPDLYDINTGKQCTNKTMPVFIGCAPGSGDIYDITTGKRCLVNIAPVVSIKNVVSVNNVPKSVTPKTTVITKVAPLALATTEPVNNTEVTDTENQISGREQIVNSLGASVVKAGSIFTGPMSFWLILLIIIIVLGGGYGIYSLVGRKEDGSLKKVEVKKVITEPIIQHKPITPVAPLTHSQTNTPNPQITPLNTSLKDSSQESIFTK